jgi:exopolysaccharide biosynthesis WecB/TagA/CpsF family protein
MIRWIMEPPRKYDLFGVGVSAVRYGDALDWVLEAARRGHSVCVDHMPVHGLMTATSDPEFAATIARCDIVAPDGQPVRWALNHIHGLTLEDRVYGPTFTLLLCRAAAAEGLPVYFYGSDEATLRRLCSNLTERFPGLQIAGVEAPPFRPLSQGEERAVVARINASGARVVFIGLGCPKQEVFAARQRGAIQAVMVCVGAAFDIHAGNVAQAPRWMQERGLEWLFRLSQEPRRLLGRYLVTNSQFLLRFSASVLTRRLRGR